MRKRGWQEPNTPWWPRGDTGAQGPTAAVWIKPTSVSVGSRGSDLQIHVHFPGTPGDPAVRASRGTQRVSPHCSPPGPAVMDGQP